MPVYASAQSSDRITVLDTFGDYDRGDSLFIYGHVAIVDDSFLIMQIINPHGDLCQIQQLMPLTNGDFITDVIPLQGRVCGVVGEYEIKLFYGDYSKSTTFNVSSDSFSAPTSDEKITLAKNLVSYQASVVSKLFDIPTPISNHTSNNLSDLESEYVALWSEFFVDDLLIEIEPLIRPAVSSSLDSVRQLLDDDEISFDTAKSINKMIFSSIFYYEIGDVPKAIGLLTDVFVEIRNLNPEKTTIQRTPTFDELEETLLNLMKKSDTIMNRQVQQEVGFIFARGIAPVYTDEIADLIDVLSKARYLDIVSRKQSDLYRLVQNDWERLKLSFDSKESIDDLLSSKTQVSDLHQVSLILQKLDNVDRFISSDSEENSDLANLIMPDWDALERDLALAASVDDILESELKINQMAQVIDISSRINKSVEISQSIDANSSLVADWKLLLERVETANSVDAILEIVSEFDTNLVLTESTSEIPDWFKNRAKLWHDMKLDDRIFFDGLGALIRNGFIQEN